MKPYTVVLTKNTAHILYDYTPGFLHSRKAQFLISPDLKPVEHVPRHFWKIHRGRLIEMDPHEKRARIEALETEHLDTNAHKHLYPFRKHILVTTLAILFGLSAEVFFHV